MMRNASRLVALLLLCLPAAVSADNAKKLTAYEEEARNLGANLPEPKQLTGEAGQRRLVDAEVAFALGDYDTAALALFDFASQPGPDRERATFYLAESLYQKGDKGAARTYFAQVVAANNTASKYYQPSLIRLVEIGIAQQDTSETEQHLAALDRLGTTQSAEAPYVRGKYAFSQGRHDDAIAQFALVPKGSSHELQALYYAGAAHVAKKDVAKATDIYVDLIARKPKTAQDRRVIELSQLALGRLHYERDELAKSIDAYLLVDRRSDLFPDALYEVAWVYVKSKQYDKALRALELLHLSEPTSQKTPTVRILEGNLRIRKAQMLRQAIISGTIEKDPVDPSVEYDKARAVFAETHDLYEPSYQALAQMVDGNLDASQFIAQIAGRSTQVFQATAPLPEAAAQYLREEPDVQRVVSIETDLGEIEAHLASSEQTISRLQAVLAANDRTAIYPALDSRRSRIGQIQDDLVKMRSELHDQLGGAGAETATRRQLAQQYASMPSPEQARTDVVARERQEYDAIEQTSSEVSAAIDSTQAMAVAIRKYAADTAATLPADLKANTAETLSVAATEAAAIERELRDIQRELVLGRDLAGVGDQAVVRAREVRRQLAAAQDAEFRTLAGRGGKLVGLADRAMKLAAQLAQIEGQIDGIADRGMAQAKLVIAQESSLITEYKAERERLQAESRSLGGTVLAASFKDVKARFYDIVIRTDVGTVDVSWAQKEDADDDLKRLNLSRQRELKQLRDEFKGIIDGGTFTTPGTAPAPAPTPAPNGGADAGTGSPDRGGGPSRVTPGADQPATPAAPVVKPDAKANETQKPSGTQPSGSAPKGGSR